MERLLLLVALTCSGQALLILSGGSSGSPLSLRQELMLSDGPQQQQQIGGGAAGVGGQGRHQCPLFCECDTWLELARASCTGRDLHSVRVGVPYVVQALDLSNNSVDKLEDKQLSRAGLTRLKYLNLSINAISEIGPNAFDDLKNITVLDLSMNRLDYIDPDTFSNNKNLRILRLAGNKFNLHVPQLRSTSLTELDFSSCRIARLLPQTFEGLKRLRKLDLSNNDLVFLDKAVLSAMPFLKDLSLSRNHFMCNTKTTDLNLYLRSANIRTELICERPSTSGGGAISLDRLIAMKTMSDADPTGRSSLPLLPGDTEPSGYTVSQPHWHVPSWRDHEEQFRPPEELFHRQPDESDVDDAEVADNEFRVSGTTNEGFNGSGVSPFWFLVTGFLLGSGATMILTYLWLSTTISCLIPRIRRVEAADTTDASSSQRVSLLRNLWQQDSMGSTEDNASSANGSTTTSPTIGHMFLPSGATVTPSCPGTPPPPYREVMLHRNLYPRAVMAAAAQQQHQVSARWLVPMSGVGSTTTNPSTTYNG
ncbi:hypothetical protein QAD02_015556 [Eretmocerus hayati]|uniref:Uncharacterized protein n=1 Tax=Eretmocerus hayati TaxID=131215 RepID=A0ACC2P910_9HYME|nr:hypothetical protein QAD02_015556 [Eretmocerus hayati]